LLAKIDFINLYLIFFGYLPENIKTQNMSVISSKEFITNQKKYFDMALDREVLVKYEVCRFQ